MSLGQVGGILPPNSHSTGIGVMPPIPAMPDRGIPLFSNIGQPAVQRTKQYVMPRVPYGGGMLSSLGQRMRGLDAVGGLDRMLGKTKIIAQGKKMAQHSKNLGNLSVSQALGSLTGRVLDRWI